jgi:hypothetical protein
MTEKEPMKSDELATEMRRVLGERAFLRNTLIITMQLKQENE